MSIMVSEIHYNLAVCSSACLVTNKENIKALYYWPFVMGIHQLLVDSPHKEPAMMKACPYKDIIMVSITEALPKE